MAVSKPTIVLVPGAYHGPAAFDPILPLLHAAGYTTTAVSLPSVGVSPGHSDFKADVDAVRATVGGLTQLGRETVLVSHSYGAVVTSEAARGLSRTERRDQGLSGGVVELVYVAAIIPKVGENVGECLGDQGDEIPDKELVNHGV